MDFRRSRCVYSLQAYVERSPVATSIVGTASIVALFVFVGAEAEALPHGSPAAGAGSTGVERLRSGCGAVDARVERRRVCRVERAVSRGRA